MRAILCSDGELSWGEAPDPEPKNGEIVIEVAATSVNRADLLQRRGLYPPPPGASPILGLEAAGTVVHAAGRFSEGDQVMAILSGGGYAERVACSAAHALPIPSAVGLPAAGGVMEVFLTATLNLLVLGEVQAGQRVLIHGGAGGVGTAAIQLARALGAEVWATASASKLDLCLQLGATRAIDYRSEDFASLLEEAGGAQLILDCIGAKYLDQNLRGLATDGTLVVIGLQGGVKAELNLLEVLSRRIRVQGSTLRSLPADRKAALVARFRKTAWPLLDSGRLKLVVDRAIPLSDVDDAHRAMGESTHRGKLLLTL